MANLTSRPHGVYREHGHDDLSAVVYVSYGAHGYPITADLYVGEGYSPPFNALPWKEDYQARQDPAET